MNTISQTALIVGITESVLGGPGKIILGVIVALACLTTAIGLTSATGNYFSKLTNGKLKYEVIVTIVSVFSAIVSNFGVNAIIKISAPILSMVYPATILLVVMTLFSDKIKNDNAFKGATYVTIIISILTVMNVPLMNNLPLASLGFNWIVPAIIGGVIGNFIKTNKNIDIQAESNFNNASLE